MSIDLEALAAWMDDNGLAKGAPIEHRFISGGSQNVSPHAAVHAQSIGHSLHVSGALQVPSPHRGQLGSQVAPGGHSGEHAAQQSGSEQPASPSPSRSSSIVHSS